MKIIILGAGSFGCSIAQVLVDNKHEVTLWSHNQQEVVELTKTRKNPHIEGGFIDKSVKITSEIKVANEADMIVFVVPSFAVRETAKKLNKVLTEKKIFVMCTKGLEANTMKSCHSIVEEEIKLMGGNVILSGPTHAEELSLRKHTAIVSTSTSKEAREIVQKVFNNNYLRVYTNNDVMGVEILGAAKNILAIAAGFCDSHPSLGDNAKAALLTRGLRELKQIGDCENCRPETFYGLTGLGDLMVTATSKHSRNRRFGELLGQGLSIEEAKEEIQMVVEGLYSVQAINSLKEKYKLDLPIIESIYQFLYENVELETIINNLVYREMKSEV